MTRPTLALLGLLVFLEFSGSTWSAPAPRTRQPPPLARYRFNGNGKDDTGKNPDFILRNTSFKDNALYLNGVYSPGGPGAGYRAVCRTAKLDYSAFTVAFRFKAEGFEGDRRNLITGGTSYRWFGLHRSPAGNLTVTLNNQAFSREIQGAPLVTGKWTVVACVADLAARKIAVYLNGKKVADIDLRRISRSMSPRRRSRRPTRSGRSRTIPTGACSTGWSMN
jgi:hypothetical protein